MECRASFSSASYIPCFLLCPSQHVSSKCSSSFITAKEEKGGFLGSLIFSPVLFPTALLYYLNRCSAILPCSLRVQGSGWRKIYICKCLLFALHRTVITSGSASRPWLHFFVFGELKQNTAEPSVCVHIQLCDSPTNQLNFFSRKLCFLAAAVGHGEG